VRNHRLGHLLHQGLVFANTQAPQGIPVKTDINQGMGVFPPQIREHPALDNAEQELTAITPGIPATSGPARRQISGLDGLLACCRIRDAGVKAHHDIGPQGLLDGNCLLGAEKELRAIQMGAKGCAGLGDLRQFLEAEDLESAAIRQNGPIPVHELVQAAETPDQLMAGPNIQMIGIAQDNLGIHLFQVFRSHGLHRRLGAHRHENRGLEDAVQGTHLAPAGGAEDELPRRVKGDLLCMEKGLR